MIHTNTVLNKLYIMEDKYMREKQNWRELRRRHGDSTAARHGMERCSGRLMMINELIVELTQEKEEGNEQDNPEPAHGQTPV